LGSRKGLLIKATAVAGKNNSPNNKAIKLFSESLNVIKKRRKKKNRYTMRLNIFIPIH
jgi:hypothetical protein